MAVFTKISDAQFNEILEGYDIGKFIKAEGISEGVENTNYKLHTDKNSYILTIYEKRVNIEDLPFFMQLQDLLFAKGFPCPAPIKDKEGKILNDLNDKKFAIVSMIKGAWPRTINNSHVGEAASALAKLHNASNDIASSGLHRKNKMDKEFWIETYNKVSKKAEEKYSDLANSVKEAVEKLETFWPKNIPFGIIHADYFPDNVLFKNGKVSGVIDFYMACEDLYIYDLAIALNAWCFEKDHSFNITKAKIFLRSYNEIRELTDPELDSLPILCIGASMRFLSTRLYDEFNTDSNAEVNIKDPREYIEKLKFHLQVNSFSDYGI